MKRFLLLALIIGFVAPVVVQTTGCSTAPSARVAEVTTLKTLGATTAGVVTVSAKLYQQGKITADQARKINDFYDNVWQPAYRVAVLAVNSNLNSIASPDLVALATQLSALLASFTSK